jgi:hypothetical protein
MFAPITQEARVQALNNSNHHYYRAQAHAITGSRTEINMMFMIQIPPTTG